MTYGTFCQKSLHCFIHFGKNNDLNRIFYGVYDNWRPFLSYRITNILGTMYSEAVWPYIGIVTYGTFSDHHFHCSFLRMWSLSQTEKYELSFEFFQMLLSVPLHAREFWEISRFNRVILLAFLLWLMGQWNVTDGTLYPSNNKG